MKRLYTYCFCFDRVFLVYAADAAHPDHKPYLRTREQAAGLIRLGAPLRSFDNPVIARLPL
jgi:hypothetical protein